MEYLEQIIHVTARRVGGIQRGETLHNKGSVVPRPHTGTRCAHTCTQLLGALDPTTQDRVERGRETGTIGLQDSLESGHAEQTAYVDNVNTSSVAQVQCTGDNMVINPRPRWQERVDP